ncbi:uncharacterized protein LOC113470583 [Diaphorina citri]|uniref:Uncharacterized protein LOC113470583 n=1 Tax=Diaphorina citri TaxID=121845 RepID=A0A3Q0JDA3_DIACI|nr:uncharacterized protein LOC113470583 [Diaphorina citri]
MDGTLFSIFSNPYQKPHNYYTYPSPHPFIIGTGRKKTLYNHPSSPRVASPEDHDENSHSYNEDSEPELENTPDKPTALSDEEFTELQDNNHNSDTIHNNDGKDHIDNVIVKDEPFPNNETLARLPKDITHPNDRQVYANINSSTQQPQQ